MIEFAALLFILAILSPIILLIMFAGYAWWGEFFDISEHLPPEVKDLEVDPDEEYSGQNYLDD